MTAPENDRCAKAEKFKKSNATKISMFLIKTFFLNLDIFSFVLRDEVALNPITVLALQTFNFHRKTKIKRLILILFHREWSMLIILHDERTLRHLVCINPIWENVVPRRF